MQNINDFEEWETVKAEFLSNPKVYKEYKKLEPRYKVISAMIGARLKNKLSQTKLAQMAGTHQSAIARLESGSANPTIDFLSRLASAMNSQLVVQIR